MKIKDRNGYYLKNSDLVREILEFKKTNKASETLGDYLLAIANNLSSKGNFHGYTWKADMVSEAVLTCIKYLKNFDPEKSNAFAYTTQICKNSFIAQIKSEKKHSEIKDKCYKCYNDLVLVYNEEDNEIVKGAINYEQFGEKRRKKSKENIS